MEGARWDIETKLSSNLHQDLGNPIQRELAAACLRKASKGRTQLLGNLMKWALMASSMCDYCVL